MRVERVLCSYLYILHSPELTALVKEAIMVDVHGGMNQYCWGHSFGPESEV